MTDDLAQLEFDDHHGRRAPITVTPTQVAAMEEENAESFDHMFFMAIEDGMREYRDDIPRMKGGDNCIQHAVFRRVMDVFQKIVTEREEVHRQLLRYDEFSLLVADARREAERAMAKYPQPTYVISKFAEESGEVVKAAVHFAEGRDTACHVEVEMMQAIAMLYRLWIEGDRMHNCRAICAAVREER